MRHAQIIYLLPVHNEQRVLVANVERLVGHLQRFPDSVVYLVENGSTDASWRIAQELAAAPRTAGGNVPVLAFREPDAGLGFAYHRGLTEAVRAFGPSPSHWAVLTAADLPFGFSDLEAALVAFESSPSRILIGSKAHPESVANTGLKRRVVSSAYRLARRAIVGMQVGDSQGSVFLRLDLASELLPQIESRGFFYSTELCHYAERQGEHIQELPVILAANERASTVRPVKHGIEMAWQLWTLRARDRRGH
jgi:dolichyl-phosphate beta-glucosyltransferase